MSSEHLGGLAGDGIDLHANLFAFPGRLDLLVVALDACHDADVQELLKRLESSNLNENFVSKQVKTRVAGSATLVILPKDLDTSNFNLRQTGLDLHSQEKNQKLS